MISGLHELVCLKGCLNVHKVFALKLWLLNALASLESAAYYVMRDKGCKCRRTSNLDPSSFVFVQSGQVKGRKLEIHRSPPSQHHAHTRKSNWSPPQLLPPNTRDGRSCTATHETQLRALKLYPAGTARDVVGGEGGKFAEFGCEEEPI